MTIIEFLESPIPVAALVSWLLFELFACFLEDVDRNRFSQKCGYDCDKCRALFCHGKACHDKRKKNSRI